MTTRKKLIEVALPLEAINVASAREKSIRHGHPSTLHLWWARRPLAAARAVIFASLVDDPDDPNALPAFVEACQRLPVPPQFAPDETPTARDRLHYFIERLVQWESTTDETLLNQARELIQIATEGSPPPLLDPFAGGGSIPLEAQRLGLEAHASDLNPVAVMINKAQIEIPPRFANQPPINPRDRQRMKNDEGWKGAAGLAADVRYYGEWMRERAWERIGHLYPTHNGETVIAWLWARTVKSPNPAVNAHVPLVRSFIVSKTKGRECWAQPIIENGTVRFEVTAGKPPAGKDGTVTRTGGTCLISGEPIPFEYIRAEGQAGRMGAMLMAIVTESKAGRQYHSSSQFHIEVAQTAHSDWRPDYSLSTHPQYMAPPRYGMTSFGDLFTSRQLAALVTFNYLIAEVRQKVLDHASLAYTYVDNTPLESGGRGAKAYSEAIAIYLAFAVSKGTNLWSSLTSWMSDRGALRETFARQAIPIVWDYAEANPFSNSGGNVLKYVERIADTLDYMTSKVIPGQASQQDAANLQLPAGGLIISTDPPYYDNVPYADLSDYFYVWLRRSLQESYPRIFSTLLVPKELELVADYQRFGGRERANEHFEEGLSKVFGYIRHKVDPSYPLTIYYAFKQIDVSDELSIDEQPAAVINTGWETMLESLKSSGFTIDGTWPVRTEGSGRIRSIGANALASSIVLVCRPRPEDAPSASRRQLVDALRRELPPALKKLQSGNIAPVDLAQASIGPGMAIYSRYSRVLEADGSPMSVRAALALINQELDAYLAEQDGDIDGDTRFAVAWFEQFGFTEGEFGRADVLARAKNTSVTGVEASGLVVSGRGKVRLIHWSEYDPARAQWSPTADKRPTIWEAVHHLIERLNSHGEAGSALLMTQMPHDMAAEARALAYRLYSICERKGWADHARDYNALVVSWAEIGIEAAKIRQQRSAGDATTQTRMFE